jgi:DNA-binding NtrC family response regulator
VDLRIHGGEEGIDVLKYLKTKPSSPEVVIVTAYATERTKANAITLGAMEYIGKPFLMEEIYDLITRALRRRDRQGN